MNPTDRRRRGFERVSELVPRHGRRELGSWERLVGPTLAAETALVGRDGEGALRVAARNEAARHEVLARAHDLVAAFNTHAAGLGAAPASGLVCWVSAAFTSASAQSPPRAAPMAPVAPEMLIQAAQEVAERAPHADGRLTEALVRWRARSLAQRTP